MAAQCSVDGCLRKVYCRGYCTAHYSRWRKRRNVQPDLAIGYRTAGECGVPGCDKKVHAHGYCSIHYGRLKRHGDPLLVRWIRRPKGTICIVPGCQKLHFAKGYCQEHYERLHRRGTLIAVDHSPKPCQVEGCQGKALARGLCSKHYQHWWQYGDATKSYRFRRKNGERLVKLHNGYVFVKMLGHPNGNNHGYVKEHVLVMSQNLGRGLLPGEAVHHINGNKADNRIENLELWRKGHPPGQRVEDLIAYALEILQQYADQPKLWGGENLACYAALANKREVVQDILKPLDRY